VKAAWLKECFVGFDDPGQKSIVTIATCLLDDPAGWQEGRIVNADLNAAANIALRGMEHR